MTSGSSRSRRGMPDPSTVLATIQLPLAAARAGAVAGGPKRKYRILRTNQVDEYERQPASAVEVLAAPAVMKAKGDHFAGKDRKAAKLSVSNARGKRFDDLKDLIQTLPAEQAMKDQHISKDPKSRRVADEDRNVRLTTWLYAQSRENDNDFHLILGRSPQSKEEMYMTMEVSGLPPKSAASFAKLKRVRDTFMKFFADNLPGTGYDFFDPPIKVEIGGSLFFDVTHAGGGGRPGPKDLRPHMPVIWEVHPVTSLKFEP